MSEFFDMVWIELRKATRSRMPLWTTLGSLFMPLGVAGLIFLAKNPGFSRSLGLVSAKADLVAYSAADWAAYLVLLAEIVGAGAYFFFVMAVSWVFGREFMDGTLKDLLAVPVRRSSILLAKFLVVIAWCALMAGVIFAVSLLMGVLLRLPGGSLQVLLHGGRMAVVTVCLVISVVLPFALAASVGRGYLLPMAAAVLSLIMSNLVMVVGWGEYFPWAIPLLYAQDGNTLAPVSYGIVFATGLLGILSTILWWNHADQNR
jgi:ABC-2 type transport system permease protein